MTQMLARRLPEPVLPADLALAFRREYRIPFHVEWLPRSCVRWGCGRPLGTILAGVGIFAMIGVLFTAPQYFQAILGTDAMGSGVRLLPLIGGVVVGAGGADRIASRVGAKLTVAGGFTVLAAALAVGAATRVTTGYPFVAAWTAAVGAGMGATLATAASAALGELSAERAGVGSAVMQTVQKIGAPFGAAILGSVLNGGYRGHLDLTGLPGPVADAARDSVFAAIGLARKLHSPSLLDSARTSFVHGMDVMLMACGGVAAAGIVLALVFLPHRKAAPEGPGGQARLERERVG